MAAREFRFIQCVIDALCDSIGIDRPNASAASRMQGRGCGTAGRAAARRQAVASDARAQAALTDDRAIVVPRPGGWYELPAYVRRGIEIPGIEPLPAHTRLSATVRICASTLRVR